MVGEEKAKKQGPRDQGNRGTGTKGPREQATKGPRDQGNKDEPPTANSQLLAGGEAGGVDRQVEFRGKN